MGFETEQKRIIGNSKETTARLQQENTEREQMERTLAAHAEELRFLNALNAAANRGGSLAEITGLLADGLASLFNVSDVSVSYLNDAQTALVMHGNKLSGKLFQKIEKLLGFQLPQLKIKLTPDSFYAQLLAAKAPVIIDTPEELTRMMAEYADSNLPSSVPQFVRHALYKLSTEFLQMDSAVVCPLASGDTSIGVLEILGKESFFPADLERLQRIAAQLSGIIQRKRTEAALKESQNLYASLVESLPQAIFRKDRAGRFTYVNENFCQLSGHPAEDILGKTDSDLHTPDLATQYRNDDKFVMKTGIPLEVIEERDIASSKKIKQVVRTIKTPLRNTAGEIIGVQGVFEDITLQKENELRLEQSARRLDLLHQIDRAILAAQSPAEIASATLKVLLDLIPSPRASILLMDETQGKGTILAVAGTTIPANLATHDEVQLEKLGIYHRFKQHPDKIIQFTLAEKADTVEAELRRHGIAASINAMLTVDGELVGSLNIGFAHPDDIQDNYVQIIEQVADSLAVSLRQAQLTEQIRKDAAIKTRLLQEVDHRVKNNLTSIMGMLFLETRFARAENQPISPVAMENMRRRVQCLNALHEMLSGNQWEPLPLHGLLSRIVNAAYRGSTNGMELIPHYSVPDDIIVSASTAQNLTIILTELMGNTLQHAPQACVRCEVDIAVHTDDGRISLTFRDNGAGYPAHVLAGEGMRVGLNIVRNTVSMGLHGTLTLENEGGAKTIIRFPLPTD